MGSRHDIDGAPRSLTTDEAGAVYGILIAEAGARDDEQGRERRTFVRYASKAPDRGQVFVEWRFCGKLGFGGKLYFDGRTVPRVGCYREDETPERTAIIAATNDKLLCLFTEPPSPDPHEEGAAGLWTMGGGPRGGESIS